jgi:predicted transcriptional regulator of viral defense system
MLTFVWLQIRELTARLDRQGDLQRAQEGSLASSNLRAKEHGKMAAQKSREVEALARKLDREQKARVHSLN